MSEELQLQDVPDLSGIYDDTEPEPWLNAWYEGTILESRSFTDSNGNDRLFESSDTPSAAGDSRNIRLQVQVKRASDGRTLNVSHLINYRTEDLSSQTVQAVIAKRGKVKESEGKENMGDLFRPFMTLTRLGQLQKVAGVRAFHMNGSGLDLAPLFNKKAYVRLKDDDRNPQYKQIAEFRTEQPKRAKVL